MFRRSGNSIRPIEIGRRMLREMDDQRDIDVKGDRVVPNQFTVQLSTHDYSGFADIEDALRVELVEAVREYAREERYHFMGPVTVDLVANTDLKRGRFDIESAKKEAELGQRPGYLVTDGGERIELTDDQNLIGRLNDCLVVLTDTNTSRHHARIDRAGNGFSVTDLGSTNGTYLNGQRLTAEAPLNDGDTITVGKVNLRFEAN